MMACTALHGSPYGQRGERSLVQVDLIANHGTSDIV